MKKIKIILGYLAVYGMFALMFLKLLLKLGIYEF